jgi:FKBP-type peptidyl-prolyl cis-trans isomerase
MKKGLWISIVVVIIVCVIFIIINRRNKMSDQNMQNTNTQNSMAVPAEKTAQEGDTIEVRYTGMFEDGKVFDTSNIEVARTAGIYAEGRPYEPLALTLGAHTVIPGWEEGLIGMKVGEKKHLIIAPEKAYGARGYPPVIPPNATLVFDVELVSIK